MIARAAAWRCSAASAPGASMWWRAAAGARSARPTRPEGDDPGALPRFWSGLLRGSPGLARSYAAGEWDCDDLVSLVRIGAREMPRLDRLRRPFVPLASALTRVPRNTRWPRASTWPPTTTSATTCSSSSSTRP